MLKMKSIVVVALLGAVVLISGCATTGKNYTGRKNQLVADIKPNSCESCNLWAIEKDWYRIANMTDEEICKFLHCTGETVTKEVPVYTTVTTVITKEVQGPERIVTKEVPVEKVVEGKTLFVLPGAFFDTDKSDLKPGGKLELDRAAVTLKENGFPAIIITGHTDSVGGDEYNQKLSERRADAVMKYLVDKGVPADKMSTKGYGKTKPIASNATPEGRAQNRRVEIHLAN
jgi:outer membrane protein OmpA-like peptidoglycan-associated protein